MVVGVTLAAAVDVAAHGAVKDVHMRIGWISIAIIGRSILCQVAAAEHVAYVPAAGVVGFLDGDVDGAADGAGLVVAAEHVAHDTTVDGDGDVVIHSGLVGAAVDGADAFECGADVLGVSCMAVIAGDDGSCAADGEGGCVASGFVAAAVDFGDHHGAGACALALVDSNGAAFADDAMSV